MQSLRFAADLEGDLSETHSAAFQEQSRPMRSMQDAIRRHQFLQCAHVYLRDRKEGGGIRIRAGMSEAEGMQMQSVLRQHKNSEHPSGNYL